MPKIEISKSELEKLVGRDFSIDELDNLLMLAKCELEEINGDILKVDIKDTNRPDLWCIEGIAREIKYYFEIRSKICYSDSNISVEISDGVLKIRPYIACCIVKNLEFTDDFIKQIMEQQERLHKLLGRDREKIAIGISNFDLITPNIFYKLADESIKFKPLGYDIEMTPKEILNKHEKGIKYRHLVENGIPILVDSSGEVISMPPIINSNTLGNINTNTKNIFIDVTGTDEKLVEQTLIILAYNFFDRGGKIERVKIGNKMVPELKNKIFKLDNFIKNASKISGIEFKDIKLLERKGYNIVNEGVEYPPYRKDILDERDIIEDILISYGFNKIEPLDLKISTIGEENKNEKLFKDIEELMIGFGFQQILSSVLSNEDKEDKTGQNLCKILNPASKNYTVIRASLLPSLLEVISKNQHNEYPQKIFEIGKIADNREKTRLCVIIANSIVNYNQISSVLDSLLSNLKVTYSLKSTFDKRFIENRCANIIINEEVQGIIGEISPELLSKWNIEFPVVGFEIDLGFL